MKVVGPQDDPSPREDNDPEMHWVDRWVMPYVDDSMLWPVLIVIVLHAVAILAPALLMAIRDHRIPALLVIAILLYGSVRAIVWEVRRRDGAGAITGMLLVTWTLSVIAALYGDARGWI